MMHFIDNAIDALVGNKKKQKKVRLQREVINSSSHIVITLEA